MHKTAVPVIQQFNIFCQDLTNSVTFQPVQLHSFDMLSNFPIFSQEFFTQLLVA